jgi:hypothetical protein
MRIAPRAGEQRRLDVARRPARPPAAAATDRRAVGSARDPK